MSVTQDHHPQVAISDRRRVLALCIVDGWAFLLDVRPILKQVSERTVSRHIHRHSARLLVVLSWALLELEFLLNNPRQELEREHLRLSLFSVSTLDERAEEIVKGLYQSQLIFLILVD